MPRSTGRLIHLASQDFTVAGGAAGEVHCDKIADMMELSLKTGSPFVFINDSGGARVQEGIDSLAGYGRVFYRNVMLSGTVPQISLICGPCAGGAAYSPALTDFIIQTTQRADVHHRAAGDQAGDRRGGHRRGTGRPAGADELLRAWCIWSPQTTKKRFTFAAGCSAFCLRTIWKIRRACPSTCRLRTIRSWATLLPAESKVGYDMRGIITRVLDHQDFLEIQPGFAPNIVVGFGRIAGTSGGDCREPARVLAGALDINASDKAARFIRFCNAFNIPLVTFVDVPGFLPGVQQEYGGIIRHGAKMLFAYSAATVPKVTVIVRKAYGGAYLAMCGKDLGADRVLAWPTAEDRGHGRRGRGGDRLPPRNRCRRRTRRPGARSLSNSIATPSPPPS